MYKRQEYEYEYEYEYELKFSSYEYEYELKLFPAFRRALTSEEGWKNRICPNVRILGPWLVNLWPEFLNLA